MPPLPPFSAALFPDVLVRRGRAGLGEVWAPLVVPAVPPLAWAVLAPDVLRRLAVLRVGDLVEPVFVPAVAPVPELSWAAVFPSVVPGPMSRLVAVLAAGEVFVLGAEIPPPPVITEERTQRRRWEWHRSTSGT